MTASSEYQNQILKKASENDEFRSQLMSDPSKTIGSELNIEMPESLTIQVHEDGPNVVNLVLPPKVELGDAEMQEIAAGDVQWGGDPVW